MSLSEATAPRLRVATTPPKAPTAKKIAMRTRRNSLPGHPRVTKGKISNKLIGLLSSRLANAGEGGIALTSEECDILQSLITQHDNLRRDDRVNRLAALHGLDKTISTHQLAIGEDISYQSRIFISHYTGLHSVTKRQNYKHLAGNHPHHHLSLKSAGHLVSDIQRTFRRSTAPPTNKSTHRRSILWNQRKDLKSDVIVSAVKDIDKWDEFSIFDLEKAANGQDAAALVVALEIINAKLDLLSELDVPRKTFLNYVDAVCAAYNDVPYHSCLHGADVMQSLYSIVVNNPRILEMTPPVMLFGALIAALCHDVGHIGRTNHFLVATSHPLALHYNDQSVLENMHIAKSLELTKLGDGETSCNIFAPFSKEQKASIRSIWIKLILHTDMANHVPGVFSLNQKLEREEGYDAMDSNNIISTLATLLHACDLSNPAKPWDCYNLWVGRIMHEFYSQSQDEEKLGIEITLPSESTVQLEQFQIGFIRFITPFFETVGKIPHISMEGQVKNLKANLARWEQLRYRKGEESVQSEEKVN